MSLEQPEPSAEPENPESPHWTIQILILAGFLTIAGVLAKREGDRNIEALRNFLPPAQKAPVDPGMGKGK